MPTNMTPPITPDTLATDTAAPTTTTDAEQEEALRWLIANRRPEVPLDYFLRALSFTLPEDSAIQAVLARVTKDLHTQ